jgi:malate permease and related proteins
MDLFLDILLRVSLPICALVIIGYLMQPKLKLDIGTLNRVQVYVVMPAFLIHFLSSGKQPLSIIWPVVGIGVIQFLIVIPIAWLLVMMFRQRASLGPMMGLGTAYANVGFFGIPVTTLAFGPDYVIYQSVITALVTILLSTVGVWLMAPAGQGGPFGKLRVVFETPLIPSVFIGLALRGFEIELPVVVSQPMQYLGQIFTPLALYTLGAQIAAANIVKIEIIPQVLINILRFAIAPLLTFALCLYLGFPRDITNVIVVAAATPVGVLITVFATEFKNEADFINTAVVTSTALSPIFVSGWIYAVRAW